MREKLQHLVLFIVFISYVAFSQEQIDLRFGLFPSKISKSKKFMQIDTPSVVLEHDWVLKISKGEAFALKELEAHGLSTDYPYRVYDSNQAGHQTLVVQYPKRFYKVLFCENRGFNQSRLRYVKSNLLKKDESLQWSFKLPIHFWGLTQTLDFPIWIEADSSKQHAAHCVFPFKHAWVHFDPNVDFIFSKKIISERNAILASKTILWTLIGIAIFKSMPVGASGSLSQTVRSLHLAQKVLFYQKSFQKLFHLFRVLKPITQRALFSKIIFEEGALYGALLQTNAASLMYSGLPIAMAYRIYQLGDYADLSKFASTYFGAFDDLLSLCVLTGTCYPILKAIESKDKDENLMFQTSMTLHPHVQMESYLEQLLLKFHQNKNHFMILKPHRAHYDPQDKNTSIEWVKNFPLYDAVELHWKP